MFMPVGRPRNFDIDEALDRALEVFWRHGYEGASLPMLTEAMGINRPSLYAAFGNKEALFRRTLERYTEGHAAHLLAALDEPTARSVAERLLMGTVEFLANPKQPRGCFMVQSALTCGAGAGDLQADVAKLRAASQALLKRRLQRAVKEGDLPEGADPADLARYLSTVGQGLAIQAAGGAKREELARVAELALRAWPS